METETDNNIARPLHYSNHKHVMSSAKKTETSSKAATPY